MDHAAVPQPPTQLPPPSPQPAPVPQPPSKAKSIGKRIGGAIGTLAVFIAAKAALGLWHDSKPAVDFAVGSCLAFDKTFMPKDSDIHEVSCSADNARVKVTGKYQGAKNCPNDNYATLEFGEFGMCLQEQFTVGRCYGGLGSGLANEVACRESFVSHDFKVLSRHDADNAGLCSGDGESAVTYPEPPLTYCVQSMYAELKPFPTFSG